MRCLVLVFVLAALLPRPVSASPFTYYGGPFDQIGYGVVDWGDYDGDGDLDLLLAGSIGLPYSVAWVYRNDGGNAFVRLTPGFDGSWACSAQWADYDNDGDLDVVLIGRASNGVTDMEAWLYRNDGGAFTEVTTAIAPGWITSQAWGDYDNDGDSDLLVLGQGPSGQPGTHLYRNDDGAFVNSGIVLPQLRDSAPRAVAWGDCDGDGDLDLAIAGYSASGPLTRVLRNQKGASFVDAGAPLTHVAYAAVAWADIDNDGDLDLYLQGATSTNAPHAQLLENDGTGAFTSTTMPAGLTWGSAAWGDADNDGDRDLLSTGINSANAVDVRFYVNDGTGSLSAASASILPAGASDQAWGDFDNDGDLDFMLVGYSPPASGQPEVPRSSLYLNSASVPNTAPTAPSGLSATPAALTTFTWNAASDAQTAAAGLTYNLRVGTTPGGTRSSPPCRRPRGRGWSRAWAT